jgi:hypothetical protein
MISRAAQKIYRGFKGNSKELTTVNIIIVPIASVKTDQGDS